jgi:hypothetical protein
LAVAPIQRQLLINVVRLANELDEADTEDRVDVAVSKLLASSLAESAGEGEIAVHTLVSRTLRFAEPATDRWEALRATATQVLLVEMSDAGDLQRHSELTPWVVHARELSDRLGALTWSAEAMDLPNSALRSSLTLIKRYLVWITRTPSVQ